MGTGTRTLFTGSIVVLPWTKGRPAASRLRAPVARCTPGRDVRERTHRSSSVVRQSSHL